MRKSFINSLAIAVLLIAALSVTAVACGDDDSGPVANTTEYPLTFTDHSGAEITLESKPESIVALLPSVTNIVVDLRHAGMVVGVDEFSIIEHPDAFPDAANVGGSLFQFDLEALAALEPDLVIMGDLGQNDLALQLDALGIQVVIFGFPATIDEMLDQMITIGTILGDATGAESVVADLRERLDEVAANVPQGDAVTVYMELDQSDAASPFAVGPGGLHDEALTLAGGKNIFSDANSPFPQVNHETIIDRDPQVIILLDSLELSDENAFAPISIPDAKARTGWDSVSAVQNDNVYAFNGSDLATGVRLVEGIERLAEVLTEAREKLTYLPGVASIAA